MSREHHPIRGEPGTVTDLAGAPRGPPEASDYWQALIDEKAAAEAFTLFVAARSPVYDERCDLFRLREGLRLVDVPEGPKPEPSIEGTNYRILPAK